MPLYTGVGVLVVLWWCRLNVAQGICLTWVSRSFLKAKVHMWFLFCYSSILWSLRLTKLGVLHMSVFGVPECARACVCVCMWVWLPPTRQIAEEKDNSLTWSSRLSLSYAPACVRASPTAQQASTHRDKYHTALAYEAHIYPCCPRKHIGVTALAEIQVQASAFGSSHPFPALL